MPFPETRRVIYKRNPLDEVICQLRFPPILKIDKELPADFQDRVRRSFPNYAEKGEWKLQFPAELEGQIPSEIMSQALQSTATKNYEFKSEDGSWKINLTRTFVGLTTSNYHRWEEFTEMLALPMSALLEFYPPEHFTRIGLRYVNIIRRSRLEMPDRPWSALIKPHILGILAAPRIGESVRNFESQYEVGLSDGEGGVRIRTGLVQASDNEEICYKIDNDFFAGKRLEVGQVATNKLNFLNSRSGRLFRWAITDALHEAMEPVEV
jgi:uncharacterized protein (TIGR04255 family)